MIDMVAAEAVLHGKVKGTARRAMTTAVAMRAVLLMTLMADAGYAEVLAALFGDLAAGAVARAVRVPTGTVVVHVAGGGRPGAAGRLRDMVLAGVDAEHQEHG